MERSARELAGLIAAAGLGSLAALVVLTLLGSTGEPPPDTAAWAQESAGLVRRSAEEPVLCWPEADGTLGCHPEWVEQLPGFPDGDDFAQVKVARSHLCALARDYRITCFGWGACEHGECASPEGRFRSFNVGVGANCAGWREGGVYCWGHDGLEEP